MILQNISKTPRYPSSSTTAVVLSRTKGARQDPHKLTVHQAPSQTLTHYCTPLFAEFCSAKQNIRGEFLSGKSKRCEHQHLLFSPKWNLAVDTGELSVSLMTAF